MKASCIYYKNIQRVGLAISKLSAMQDIHLAPIRGTLVQTSKGANILGAEVAVLATAAQGELPILLTNLEEFKGRMGEVVDVDWANSDVRYAQILELCQNKYVSSKNPFTTTYSIKGCSLVVSPKEDGRLMYVMRGPSGDIVTESTEVEGGTLAQCGGVRAFQYTIKTPTCEREVMVKRGTIEIMKEIVHYVNRTFVFAKFADDGKLLCETCITPTGCCETIAASSGGQIRYRFVKVPYTKVKLDPDCVVYAVDCTLDVLLRQGTVSAALRGGFQGA